MLDPTARLVRRPDESGERDLRRPPHRCRMGWLRNRGWLARRSSFGKRQNRSRLRGEIRAQAPDLAHVCRRRRQDRASLDDPEFLLTGTTKSRLIAALEISKILEW